MNKWIDGYLDVWMNMHHAVVEGGEDNEVP